MRLPSPSRRSPRSPRHDDSPLPVPPPRARPRCGRHHLELWRDPVRSWHVCWLLRLQRCVRGWHRDGGVRHQRRVVQRVHGRHLQRGHVLRSGRRLGWRRRWWRSRRGRVRELRRVLSERRVSGWLGHQRVRRFGRDLRRLHLAEPHLRRGPLPDPVRAVELRHRLLPEQHVRHADDRDGVWKCRRSLRALPGDGDVPGRRVRWKRRGRAARWRQQLRGDLHRVLRHGRRLSCRHEPRGVWKHGPHVSGLHDVPGPARLGWRALSVAVDAPAHRQFRQAVDEARALLRARA